MNSASNSEETTIDKLYETYGTVGLNSMLRDYLRNMDLETFNALLEQVFRSDKKDKNQKEEDNKTEQLKLDKLPCQLTMNG